MRIELQNEIGKQETQVDDDFDCITIVENEDGKMTTVAMKCENYPNYDFCD